MNDTDQFILSRKQIIDLVQHCGGFETEGPDYINARLSEMDAPYVPGWATHFWGKIYTSACNPPTVLMERIAIKKPA